MEPGYAVSVCLNAILLTILFVWLCRKLYHKCKGYQSLPVHSFVVQNYETNGETLDTVCIDQAQNHHMIDHQNFKTTNSLNVKELEIKIKDDDRIVSKPISRSLSPDFENITNFIDSSDENETEINERKKIERKIFEKSFELIDRGKQGRKKYPGLFLKNAYINEIDSSNDGIIDWHNVYPDLSSGGNGYIEAIVKTGELLPKHYTEKRQEIYSLADQLVRLRTSENSRFKNGSELYEQHLYAIKTWKQFKHQFKNRKQNNLK